MSLSSIKFYYKKIMLHLVFAKFLLGVPMFFHPMSQAYIQHLFSIYKQGYFFSHHIDSLLQ